MVSKPQTTEDLSVQEIIDCAGNNNDGCNGGDICSLLSWMTITNFTIHKKSDYGKNSHCGKVSAKGVQVQDFVCDRYWICASVQEKTSSNFF
jgi:cathepsin O